MLTFVAFAATVSLQDPIVPDTVVQRRYANADGVEVEGRGACEVTFTEVGCWDMDGRRDANMTDLLKALLITRNSGDISFKFRRQNRYLVVHKVGSVDQYRGTDGQYLNSSPSSHEDNIDFIRVATDLDAKNAGLIVSVNIKAETLAEDVPFKPGSGTTRMLGFEIGKPTRLAANEPNRMYVQYDGGQSKAWWSVPIELTLKDPRRRFYGTGMLGTDGKPIMYVDKDGNPVSPVKALEGQPTNAGFPGQGPAKYPRALFTGGIPSVGATISSFNVNPSKIAALRITTTRSETVLIEGFPLNPIE